MRRDWRKDMAVRWAFYALLIWLAAGCSTATTRVLSTPKEIECEKYAESNKVPIQPTPAWAILLDFGISYSASQRDSQERDKERIFNECVKGE